MVTSFSRLNTAQGVLYLVASLYIVLASHGRGSDQSRILSEPFDESYLHILIPSAQLDAPE